MNKNVRNLLNNFLYNFEKYSRCWFETPKFYRDEFILCASFPKSGNTWFRFIVSNINNMIGNFNEEINFHTIRYFSPEIRRNRKLDNAKIIENFPIFLKTHFPYTFLFRKYKSVLLIRRPEDVMVSYYIYLRDEKFKKLPPLSEFIKHWRYGIPAWINFHKSWFGHYNYLIRYEDLLKDPFKIIKEMYQYFGYNVTDDVIKKALILSSKENMRKVLKERGDPMAKNKNFQFVRKGTIGEGKKKLSNKELNYIKENTLEILEKYGYEC